MDTMEMQIGDIARDVWLSMLGLEIQPAVPADLKIAATERSLIGCVHISGAWEGTVIVEIAAELARRATEVMFDLEPGTASQEEIHDAIGEMANMIGGNMKTLVPSPSQLSLPSVSEGTGLALSVPGARRVNQLALQSEGKLLIVSLMQKQSGSDNGASPGTSPGEES